MKEIDVVERLERVKQLKNVDIREIKMLRVKELAEAQGLKLNDFIKFLGLQWVVMSKIWYNNGVNLNKGTLMQIAAFLGVEVKELFKDGDSDDL